MIKIEFKSEFIDSPILIEYNDNELSIISANLNNQDISSKIQEQYNKNISILNNLINNLNINVSGLVQINESKKTRYILDDNNYKQVLTNILNKLKDKEQIPSLCINFTEYYKLNDDNVIDIVFNIQSKLDDIKVRWNKLNEQKINQSNQNQISNTPVKQPNINFNLDILKFELYDINKPNELKIYNDLYELNKYIQKFNLVDNDDKTTNKIEHSSNHLNIQFKLEYYDKLVTKVHKVYYLTLRKLSSIIQLQSLIVQYYQLIRDNNILTPKETRGRKEGMLIGTKYKKHIIKSNKE